jgi:flagellar basal body-associated protein FliL
MKGMREIHTQKSGLVGIIATVFALICMFVGMIGLFPFTASAHTLSNSGRIYGQLQDGTKRNAPVAGQSVTLQIAQDNSGRDLTTVKTDAQGNYSFDGLDTSKGTAYVLYTSYQGAQYFTDLIDLSSKPAQRVDLQVFEASPDTSNIAIVQANALVDKVDAKNGLLTISENFFFENLGLTTYVGTLSANGHKPNALRFALPPGARNLSLSAGFNGYHVIQVDPGFASDAAITPGTSQFAFSFQVPYTGTHYDLSYTAVYPTVDFSLLVPLDYHATSGTLQSKGTRNVNQRSFQVLEAQKLVAGTQVHAELDGLPAAQNTPASAPTSQNTPWIIAIIVFMIVVIVVTWFIYLRMQRRRRAARRKRPARKARETVKAPIQSGKPKTKTAAGEPQEQEQLLQELLALDKSYETGKIKKVEYTERRAKLKAQLRHLMETQPPKKTTASKKP